MKRILAVGFTLLLVMTVSADFISDFQAAEQLFAQHKWAAAAAEFEKLESTAADADAKDRCGVFAARALGMQRKYDDAIKRTDRIANPRLKAFARMDIMSSNGQFQLLYDTYKDENIVEWPENIAYRGFFLRGNAGSMLGIDRTSVIADLEKAAAEAGSDSLIKILSLSSLAETYAKEKNIDKALASADQAIAIKGFSGFYAWISTVLLKGRLLTEQGRFNDAEATLKLLDGRDWGPDNPWQCLHLEAFGDLEAARGSKDKAKAFYTRAAAVKTHKVYIDRINKKLEAL